MKKLKIIGLFVVSLLVLSMFSIYSGCDIGTANAENFSAKEKLPALLSDVIGLDLSKYTLTNERSATQYLYGNSVEVENCAFELVDVKGSELTVRGHFYNGIPNSINVGVVDSSFYYAIDTPKNSVEKMKNILERYEIFAQKYGVATLDVSLALDLLNKAPTALPAQGVPANVSLGNMTLFIAQNSFSFVYTVNGVIVPNRGWSIDFMDNAISFSDSFGLYRVCDVNTYASEEEFVSFAFVLAQKFCDDHLFYQVGEDGVEVEVRPDWSNMRSEVGLLMISGQQYNNPINNELLAQGTGVSFSADRDALTLYPFWSAVFYFSYPIGNVYGVQVGVWGDTGEVAYCWEQGFLGNSQNTYNDSTVEPSNSGNLLGLAVIIALIAVVIMVVVVMFIKKNRK
ncbi:MAG: hypothetical protein FWF66_06940 [Candidatus Bathyarchaeota archaeon]|nr:hypothetical protein [Candidatus Termiticorpusculum sp.]